MACGAGESNVLEGNRTGILHYGNGAEPQGLDPHVVTGVPENHLIRALFEGLAVKNPITLEPEPGVAQRWEFSDQGKVITFYLNPEACVELESGAASANRQPVCLHALPRQKRRGLC